MTTHETPILAVDEATNAPSARTYYDYAGLALGLLLLLFFAFRVFAAVYDDAFITFRYALNLKNGMGAVFNPGEHTEGYSCPLYMVLTSGLMFLPGDALFRAKILGLLCAIGVLWAAWQLARELELPVWARASVPVLLGANGGFAFTAIDAMETPLQALLVTLAALYFIRERREGKGWVSSTLFLAVALNRAEGAMFFVIACVLVAVEWKISRNRQSPKDLIRWIAIFGAPFALFLLFRIAYYGDVMPNTYYAKRMPLLSALDPGLGPAYLLRTVFIELRERIALVVFSVFAWIAAISGGLSEMLRQPDKYAPLVLPLFVAAQSLVALRAGGDWMLGWRYMAAVVPLWTILFALGMSEMAKSFGEKGEMAGRALGMAGVALFAGAALWGADEFHSANDAGRSWAQQNYATDSRGLFRQTIMENTVITADVLNARIPRGATIAFSEMGATTFYSPDLRWLDTHGLTDHYIAHMDGVTRFRTGVTGSYIDPSDPVGAALIKRRPDYILLWTDASRYATPILNGLYIPAFRAPVKSFGTTDQHVLQVWKRVN